jgi:hypothetical protein
VTEKGRKLGFQPVRFPPQAERLLLPAALLTLSKRVVDIADVLCKGSGLFCHLLGPIRRSRRYDNLEMFIYCFSVRAVQYGLEYLN